MNKFTNESLHRNSSMKYPQPQSSAQMSPEPFTKTVVRANPTFEEKYKKLQRNEQMKNQRSQAQPSQTQSMMGGRRQQDEEEDKTNQRKKAQRSKTLNNSNVSRDHKFRELIGDFKQNEIEKFTHLRPELPGLSEEARREGHSTDVQDIDIRHTREKQKVKGTNEEGIVNAQFLNQVYTTMEKEFEQKKSFSSRDWMTKNDQEKPQTFQNFKSHVKNWDINECIIFEMWDDQKDPTLAAQEKNFQKMLVNNMESVFKIFFRGMQTVRVNNDNGSKLNVESSLRRLNDKGIIQSRVRPDTNVRQFHAGLIFDYLKKNIRLESNQCLLVLTNADLYPKEGWTFVFGMTKQSWRICIQSYARHHPNFGKQENPMRQFTSKIARQVQYRAVKTACHEISHVLSIRHCQGYECLMNGSSQLEEADNKPFALCPICLRKMSSYLGFCGQELALFKELRDVFKLMNHNDTQQSFKREIKLFERVIAKLEEIYMFQDQSVRSLQEVNQEGGHQELIRQEKNKIDLGVQINSQKKAFDDQQSDTSSNITLKNVSTIQQGKQIHIRELIRTESRMGSFCRFLSQCFNCFHTENQQQQFNEQRGQGAKNKKIKKKATLGEMQMGQQIDLEKGSSAQRLNYDQETDKYNSSEYPTSNKGIKDPAIYHIDQNGIQKISHRQKQSKSKF